jgi:hypothetical protein
VVDQRVRKQRWRGINAQTQQQILKVKRGAFISDKNEAFVIADFIITRWDTLIEQTASFVSNHKPT